MSSKEAKVDIQRFQDDIYSGIHTGTSEDAADMGRLGRKQEFKVTFAASWIGYQADLFCQQRNFGSFSILGLTCVAMATVRLSNS